MKRIAAVSLVAALAAAAVFGAGASASAAPAAVSEISSTELPGGTTTISGITRHMFTAKVTTGDGVPAPGRFVQLQVWDDVKAAWQPYNYAHADSNGEWTTSVPPANRAVKWRLRTPATSTHPEDTSPPATINRVRETVTTARVGAAESNSALYPVELKFEVGAPAGTKVYLQKQIDGRFVQAKTGYTASDKIASFTIPAAGQNSPATSAPQFRVIVPSFATGYRDTYSQTWTVQIHNPFQQPVAPEPAPEPEWPDASNTGVPAGTVLKTYTGPYNITTAGTVIDGYDIRGALTISAPDVTIKNSKVTGRIDTGDANRNPRTMIQRVEIIGPYDSASDGGYAAVGYTGFTCDGCKVRGWGKGFALSRDVVVKNSWVYDIMVHGDPANGGSHNETIISLGGSNFQILNNRLDAGDAGNVSASLALYSQMEAFDNVLVEGNLFDGGGYCLYAGLAGTHGASNTRIIDNTFGNKYAPRCGWYGPATAYGSGNGNAWSGNVLQSTGETVGAPGL